MLRRNSVVFLLVAALSSGCGLDRPPGEGFTVALVDSGEVILTDRHVAAYLPDRHRLRLSAEGIERWESFARFEPWRGGMVRKLGRLTGEEFVVTIRGREVLRGRFASMLQSSIQPGFVILDTNGALFGELWIQYNGLPGEPTRDLRDLEPIESYFASCGKLDAAAGPHSNSNGLEATP